MTIKELTEILLYAKNNPNVRITGIDSYNNTYYFTGEDAAENLAAFPREKVFFKDKDAEIKPKYYTHKDWLEIFYSERPVWIKHLVLENTYCLITGISPLRLNTSFFSYNISIDQKIEYSYDLTSWHTNEL